MLNVAAGGGIASFLISARLHLHLGRQQRHNDLLGKDVVLIGHFLKSAGASTFAKATADKP
ncbi:MAG: hypothetical protein ACO3ZG_00995, partial [Kiritimatiellia bacterium]